MFAADLFTLSLAEDWAVRGGGMRQHHSSSGVIGAIGGGGTSSVVGGGGGTSSVASGCGGTSSVAGGDVVMREHLLKILIVGDGNVGKTSFITRYVHGHYSRNYKATIGVDFSLKILHWSDRERVRLHLWDIAGQERFTSMTRIYYKGALGCILMFDITDSKSFLSCRLWKKDLDLKTMLPNGQPLPCILLANKCDLSDRAVSRDSIDKFSIANGFVSWMETSVKENRNIGEAMRRVVEEVLSVQSSPVPVLDTPQTLIQSEPEPDQPRARCC